jgi:hypothetical protein
MSPQVFGLPQELLSCSEHKYAFLVPGGILSFGYVAICLRNCDAVLHRNYWTWKRRFAAVFTRAPGYYHDSGESNLQSKSFAVLIHFNIVTDLLKAWLGKHGQRATMEDVSQWTNVIACCFATAHQWRRWLRIMWLVLCVFFFMQKENCVFVRGPCRGYITRFTD